ncbi:STS14 protein [Benincasa hispida]|uniref:STS14 protein n=1 Tax=Benincasa hispida TaxID=102211 RepID=UPI0019015CA2|nr:STS14 protein [Benincasa hispida]
MAINQTLLPLLAFLVLFQILIDQSSAAAAPPTAPLSAAASEYLEAHNRARAEVGVEPLQWSQNLANLTDRLVRFQRNQKGCGFAELSGSRYGGNQMWARGQILTPRAAVEGWVKEKAFYNHTSNTCVGDHHCGVYTQVVWRKSAEVGCAQATCRKEGISLTICFYNPPGNVVGESPY